MKDQRTTLQHRSVFFTVTAILLMLVVSVMGFTAIVSAAEQTEIKVTEENFTLGENSNMTYENGMYVKEYDGTSDGILIANDAKPIVDKDGNTVNAKIVDVKATFVDATGAAVTNAGAATHIKVDFEFDSLQYNAAGLLLPAKIVPCETTSETVEVTYNPTGIKINSLNSYTLASTLNLGVLNAGEHEVAANVLSSDGNYKFTKIAVKVNPIVITEIKWSKNTWAYGDAAVAPEAYAGNVPYGALKVTAVRTSDSDGEWAKGDVGSYKLTAEPVNGNFVLADDVIGATQDVTITRKTFTVIIADTIKAGDGLNAFFPTVEGIDNPEVLGLVKFLNEDGSEFEGIKFGTATVNVKLPESANYVFVDEDGATVTNTTVTVKIGHTQKLFPVYDKSGAQVGSIILVANGEGGFFDDVTVEATAIKGYPKIVKSKYSQVYEIKIVGAAEGETFTVLIPLNDTVYAPRTSGLENAFYVYNTLSGKLVTAADAGLTATLRSGYYEVSGFKGAATVAIAPDYNAPFFQTVWGILLIIVIVLAILALMCYVGLYLRRVRETEETTEVVIDTVGELPETEPVAVEAAEEVDVDAVIEENIEEAAETVEEVAEEVVVDEAELQSAVEESVQDLMEEVAEIELPEEVVEEVAEEVVEEAAEEVVEEAAEEVVAEAAEEVVAEAAEELVIEEAAEAAPAVEEVVEAAAEEVAAEAVAEAAEEATADEENSSDDDNDNDADNGDDADGDDAVEAVSMVEEDNAFGFGVSADAATFIDVKENPEAYQEMLDREARGEIKIVYRYKKSFQSKLAQSQGNVQDYYSELKNALLTFKGVKNRLSWNYEAFNKGRTHVAKMDAKSKTLYLYLALDPSQFDDTKYGVVNVSAKRRYASTPTLIKIKGERKFKHALELIEKLCGEQMELAKAEAENVDYRIERMTIDELVDAGLMKKIAGYVIIPSQDEAVPADASVESAPEQN